MAEQSEVTFEQAIGRLEEIVDLLDGGDLTLEESLKLFEEGIALARKCNSQLDEAQGRLEKLTKKSDGTLDTEPHDL